MAIAVNKVLTYLLLATMTLLPWNATAVNHYSFTHFFIKPKPEIFKNLAEALLVKSLLEITQGKNSQALVTINQLLLIKPDFKLANLIRGDLLMAQAQHLQAFGNVNKKSTVAVHDLQDEARVRIGRYLSNQQLDALPNLLIAPSDQQSHVIVVDTDKSRLYLYRNEHNSLTYESDYYITVGKNGVVKQNEGDKRTPIGVYFVGKKLTQPLANIYGDAAFPLNYPNEWDAEHGKKGSGIWMHGTPTNTYSRPPRASDGCVVLTNEDIKTLSPILQTGRTPVIIANHLKWLGAENNSSEKKALKEALDSWLHDWKSQNTPKYLSHYSHNFSSNGLNYKQWSKQKYSAQPSKDITSISLSDISMFSYPDADKKLVVVDFLQGSQSPHLSNKIHKRQYWIQENNIWKIIYEGSV